MHIFDAELSCAYGSAFDRVSFTSTFSENEALRSSLFLPKINVGIDINKEIGRQVELSKLGKRLRGINVQLANDIEQKGQFSVDMGRRIVKVLNHPIHSPEDFDDYIAALQRVVEEYLVQDEVRSFDVWDACKADFYASLSKKDKSRGDTVTQFYGKVRVSVKRATISLKNALNHFRNVHDILESNAPEAQIENLATRELRQFNKRLEECIQSLAEVYVQARQTLEAFD